MRRNDIAFQIKQRVNIQQAAARYGYEQNRAGFIRCPFHNDKTPSLKIYPNSNSYYCFGCGVGGDVISFIMHLFRLDFTGAIIRLDEDFGLYLIRRANSREQAWAREAMAEWKAKARREPALEFWYGIIYRTVCAEFRRMRGIYLGKKPKSPEVSLNPDFIHALHNLEYFEYWLESYNTFEKWKGAYGDWMNL